MPAARPLTAIQTQTGDHPTACIVWMHGLGADGRDFLPLAAELDLAAVGPVRFIFPNAPQIPVTVNGGYVMPAWYDILGADLTRREDEAGLRQSCTDLTGILDSQVEGGIAPGRIVLAGFSQGCAMALMTGLRYPARLAGILGLSGYLPLPDTTEAERSAASVHTPVMLAHGQYDGIVPMARAEATRDRLLALGHTVQWHDYPMEHSVCPQEVADIQAWLLRVLAA